MELVAPVQIILKLSLINKLCVNMGGSCLRRQTVVW